MLTNLPTRLDDSRRDRGVLEGTGDAEKLLLTEALAFG
jgi:hypothetical protein